MYSPECESPMNSYGPNWPIEMQIVGRVHGCGEHPISESLWQMPPQSPEEDTHSYPRVREGLTPTTSRSGNEASLALDPWGIDPHCQRNTQQPPRPPCSEFRRRRRGLANFRRVSRFERRSRCRLTATADAQGHPGEHLIGEIPWHMPPRAPEEDAHSYPRVRGGLTPTTPWCGNEASLAMDPWKIDSHCQRNAQQPPDQVALK